MLSEQDLGGSLVGVWNGWGIEFQFFGLWIFKFRSLKFGKNRSFCGISGIFLESSASEKYFSDSGKWPFHTPIHTPTKCRPKDFFATIFRGCASAGGAALIMPHVTCSRGVAARFTLQTATQICRHESRVCCPENMPQKCSRSSGSSDVRQIPCDRKLLYYSNYFSWN